MEIKDFSNYLFRPSAIGNIVAGLKVGLTEVQEKNLNELTLKKESGKITDKQQENLNDLINKKNAEPELSAGAKTFLEKLYKEEVFNVKKEVHSKYLSKGNAVEQENISQYNSFKGLFLMKNEMRFENDFFSGEPDCIEGDTIFEIKSSWDIFTFPLFSDELPNKDYYYQVQAYMDILGLKNAVIIYGLVNTPQELIDAEKMRFIRENVADELSDEEDELIDSRLKYDSVPVSLKIKEYPIERSEEAIDLMKKAVLLSRNYLTSLTKKINK